MADIWTEHEALCEIRESYIRNNKRFSKIKAMAIDAEKKRIEFWARVRAIHVNIKGQEMRYGDGDLFVTITPTIDTVRS